MLDIRAGNGPSKRNLIGIETMSMSPVLAPRPAHRIRAIFCILFRSINTSTNQSINPPIRAQSVI